MEVAVSFSLPLAQPPRVLGGFKVASNSAAGQCMQMAIDDRDIVFAELPVHAPQPALSPSTLLPVIVLHYDGREGPRRYGVPVLRSATIADVGNALAHLIDLAPNERFIFGYIGTTRTSAKKYAYNLGVLVEPDSIACARDVSGNLAAWRVPVADEYACISTGGVTAPIISSRPASAFLAAITTALAPFTSSLGVVAISSHTMVSSENIREWRVVLSSDTDIVFGGFKDCHESGAPRQFLPSLLEGAVHRHYEWLRHMATPETQLATLTPKFYQDRQESVMRASATALDVTIRSFKHQHVPVHSSFKLRPEDYAKQERYFAALVITGSMMDGQDSNCLLEMLEMTSGSRALQPGGVTTPLQPHQLENLHFMLDRETRMLFSDVVCVLPPTPSGLVRVFYPADPECLFSSSAPRCSGRRGGMLCDDVGMGKTLSIIALIAAAGPDPAPPPDMHSRATLIVCPTSILGQWRSEITEHFPSAKTVLYHGKDRAAITVPDLLGADVVITTQTMYSSHAELHDITWHRAVIDESHTITPIFSKAPPNTGRVWCVSATPMEHLDRQLRVLGLGSILPEAKSVWPHPWPLLNIRIHYIMRTCMVRHSKTQQVLPAVRQRYVPIHLDAADRAVYAAVAENGRRRITSLDGRISVVQLLHALQPLRNVCSSAGEAEEQRAGTFDVHTALVAPSDDICAVCLGLYETPTVTACGHWFCNECIMQSTHHKTQCPMCRSACPRKDLRVGVPNGFVLPADEASGSAAAATSSCMSKLRAVVQTVDDILERDPTAKVLVFGHNASALQRLGPALQAHGARAICGRTPAAQRTSAIAAFQTQADTRVFLLNVRSCAAGITLTAANHIVIIDAGGSPAAIQQVIGRAHRFGQAREVTVHHLYAEDTFEAAMVKPEFQMCADALLAFFPDVPHFKRARYV